MMLNFIAYAKPRLETRLLREALSVPQIVDPKFFLKPGSILREDSITKLCKSLVRKSNDGQFFEFAHFSVQEFLNGELLSFPELERFRVSESTCAQLLAVQCLNYLQLKNFDHWPKEDMGELKYMANRSERYPLYEYATEMWPQYARYVWTEKSVSDTARSFFYSENASNFKSWAVQLILHAGREIAAARYPEDDSDDPDYSEKESYDDEDQLAMISKVMSPSFSNLHVAAALSLSTMCSSLLESGADVDRKSPFGCPLQCAVQGLFLASFDGLYHPKELEMLTGYTNSGGVDDSWLRNFIHFAADTVKCLLNAGATNDLVCSNPFPGQDLISVALYRTYFDKDLVVVRVLIQAGLGITETFLNNFRNAVEWLNVDVREEYNESLSSFLSDLKSIIQVLGRRVDESRVYSEIYELAWKLVLRAGSNLALDLHIIDTRMLFTENSLKEALISASQEGDLEVLGKILEDPRITGSGFLGPAGESPFDRVCSRMVAEEALPVCRALIEASCTAKVNPDRGGLLPIHHFSKLILPAGDRHLFEEFGSLVQELSRQGAGCNSCGPDGCTALHHLVDKWDGSIVTAEAMLQFDTDSNVSKALETTDKDGYTPCSYAIAERNEDLALLFLERAKELPGAFQSPIPILYLCVQSGTARVYSALVESGVKTGNSNDGAASRETALHHLTWRTSASFVRRLISDDPSALMLRIDGNIPLDIFLQSWMSYSVGHDAILNTSLVEELASPRDLDASEKALSIERFIFTIRKIKLGYSHRCARQPFVSAAMDVLFQHSFVDSFETVRNRSFVLCILEQAFEEGPSTGWSLQHIYPFSPSTICEIIQRTGSHFWGTLKVSILVLRLLKAAIKSRNYELVSLLLAKGVSVHQRCDSPLQSALEWACLIASPQKQKKDIFSLLLDNADKGRLSEVNPHDPKKRGLIHLLADENSDMSWHVNELLQRGADINLRTGDYWKLPALNWHIYRRSLETVRELLKHGVDPTLQDSAGYDAILCAAHEGMVPLLEELSNMTSSDRSVSWKTTCEIYPRVQGVENVIGGANALHVAAIVGDRATMSLLVENSAKLNPRARDGSLPLHLAVRNGHIDTVKFLVEEHDAEMDVDIYGMSPASYAFQMKNEEITEVLQRASADLRQHPISGHITKELIMAFEDAILDENLLFCDELLSRGCDPDMELTSECCCGTPLILAIAHLKPKAVQWLLDRNVCTTMHVLTSAQYFAPLDALIRQSSYNRFLPSMLDDLYRDGGSILRHFPSLVSAAVQAGNNVGLNILLRQAEQHGEIER